MDSTQVIIATGLLLNTFGLGGIFTWIFYVSHNIKNLVNDSAAFKKFMSNQYQTNNEINLKMHDLSHQNELVHKEFSFIKEQLNEIKVLLKNK